MTQLHGVETIELDSGTVAVETIQTAIIGLVGTAQNASAGTASSGTIGTPLLDNVLTFTAVKPGRDGNTFQVVGKAARPGDKTQAAFSAGKLTLLLASDAQGVLTATAAEVAASVNALKDAPITARAVGKGITDAFTLSLSGGEDEPFPLNTPVAVSTASQLRALGGVGTLPAAVREIASQTTALMIIVRVDGRLAGPAAMVTEDGQALTTQDGKVLLTEQDYALDASDRKNLLAGINAWSLSESENGYRPRILIAPGFSEDDGVAKALEAAANKLRAVAYVDCASMATAAEVVKRRQMFGARTELLRPRVRVADSEGGLSLRPYSAFAAGLRARIDKDKGWWWSKSNQEVLNILGVEQIDEFILGEENCQANLLNMQEVSTLIRYNGYRHWGNRLCNTHPQWRFESVRRTADVIEDSIQKTMLLYVDRPLDRQNIDDIVGTINSYLRQLTALGAIFGGRAWPDEELNTQESLAAGVLYIDYDFGPKSPTELITLRVRINNDYSIEELEAA